MDSAQIHGVNATWNFIFDLLQSKRVQLIWFPKYSSEFNPVKLFWRYLKDHLRNLSSAKEYSNLKNHVVNISASLSLDMILGWFYEAITKWQYG